MAPLLETARLRLRPIAGSDVDRWIGVTSDPAVVRYLGGVPLAPEDTARRLLASAGSWTLHGFGYWAVTEREGDGRMIGHVGFADFRRDMVPMIAGYPEMGWVLAAEAHGRGIAGEAVAAALDWADRTLGREIVAIIDPGNAASIRVATRAGFARECVARYKNEDILLFRRPPPA